jgi:hypothetical protein
MADNGWLLECCNNTSLTVRVLDTDPLGIFLTGANIGEVFRTSGTGVSGLCLGVQYAGLNPTAGNRQFKSDVTALLLTDVCGGFGCSQTECNVALENFPTQTLTVSNVVPCSQYIIDVNELFNNIFEFYYVDCVETIAGPCTTGDTIFNQVYSVPYSINIHAITNTLQIPDEYTGYTITTICTGC